MNAISLNHPVNRPAMVAELRRRLWAGLIAMACGALLWTAATLHAEQAGVGTHTQLGLPACSFKVAMGLPCPSCGMTTAFAHAANGHLIEAFITQPLGALLAVLAAMALVISVYVAATGMPISRWLRPLRSATAMWIGLGAILAAWCYKMAIYQGA